MGKTSNVDLELVSYLASFTHDPVGFVWAAFPWGEGPLENMRPQEWQLEILGEIRDKFKTPDEAIREAVASGHGVGKANACTTVVDTPTGKRIWGTLQPGDCVFGADGAAAKILECKRYRFIPFYRVTFDDGSYTDVSSGHLWNVKGRNDRRTGKDFRTMSTIDILEAGIRRKNGVSEARQWEIPIQGAAQFPPIATALHPYLMGVWLGDGSRGTSSYMKPYPEISDRLRELGYNVNIQRDGRVYVRNIKHLITHPVFQCYSQERYIPDVYKYNSAENRRELLCGLMDTDGEISSHSSCIYSTTSRRLAEDVLWLVRSLGGKAQLQPTPKQGWYYNERRERIPGRLCYRITMTLPFNPFRVEHRRKRYKPVQHRYLCRWIDSIEYIGQRDGMCISVDRPDGLYLANDFIVTHNSALVAWLILWAMTTHEDTRGVITANTDGQLKSKTWAELATWYNRFVAKDMFVYTATSLFSAQSGHERTWRVDAIPWSERNTEAFAGLHNHGKRILVIFDEASAIIDKIWEVTDGAMTDSDTEKLWVAFGNPTRTSGRFFDCFHKHRSVWNTRQIDSRSVVISDKKEIEKWREMWGEDSDFFKVRVKGEFPSASDAQFISTKIVEQAQRRIPNESVVRKAPVIIGVDPAWTGSDSLEIVMRQGPLYRHLLTQGKNDDDARIAGIIARMQDQYKAAAVFIDQGYGTGIYSMGKLLGREWTLVSFAEKPDDVYYANKRAEMWASMKRWLQSDGVIDDDQQLADDLTGPEAFMNHSGRLQLESKDDMKKRGLASPNKADALALTFAYPVSASVWNEMRDPAGGCNTDYNPF